MPSSPMATPAGLWRRAHGRADDQDEAAINKRHDIYYDDKTGTLAAAHYFKALAEKGETKYIVLNGQGTIDSIKETLIKELGLN